VTIDGKKIRTQGKNASFGETWHDRWCGVVE